MAFASLNKDLSTRVFCRVIREAATPAVKHPAEEIVLLEAVERGRLEWESLL